MSSVTESTEHKKERKQSNRVSLKRESRRRKKTVYTEEQSAILEDLFWKNRFPSWKDRSQIAEKLNVGEDRIMVWFHNRRARLSKSKNNRRPAFPEAETSHVPEAQTIRVPNAQASHVPQEAQASHVPQEAQASHVPQEAQAIQVPQQCIFRPWE